MLHWALMLTTMALFNTSISKVLSLFVGRKLHAKSCASYFSQSRLRKGIFYGLTIWPWPTNDQFTHVSHPI